MVGFLDFMNKMLYIWVIKPDKPRAIYSTLSPSWPIGRLIWLTLFIKAIY